MQVNIRMPGVRGQVIEVIVLTAYALHLPTEYRMAQAAWLNVVRSGVTEFR